MVISRNFYKLSSSMPLNKNIDAKAGSYPDDWRVEKLKDVLHVNRESLPSKTDPTYAFKYITIEAVDTCSIDYGSCNEYLFGEAPGRARRILRDQDILISGVRPNLKSFAIYKEPKEGNWICSTGLYVLTAKENQNPIFFFNQILGDVGERQFHSYVAGTNYPAIGDREVKNMRLLSPPKNEQDSIASILSSVDDSIEAVRESIAAAEKLKKALMQNLLTGKLKVDGTWRAGDEFKTTKQNDAIPRGWNEARFKTKILDKSGYTWSKSQESKIATQDSIRVLTVSNVQKNLDLEPELYLSNVSEKDYLQKRVSKDWTIAVSSNGNRNRIGNAVFIEEDSEYLFASFLVAFRPQDPDEILPKYFYYWLNSDPIQAIISSISEGTTGLGNLDLRHPRSSKIYFPSSSVEQEEVVEILTQQDSCISVKRSKIEELTFLKKGLMQNLLTGKKRIDAEKINHLLNQS